MVGLSARKLIQEQASLAGFRPEEQVIKLLTKWLDDGGDENLLPQIFTNADTGGSVKVTAEAVQEALEALLGDGQAEEFIHVISAFEAPRVLYDPLRKSFFRPDAPPKLLGNAQDKMDLYINRYLLLQQRLRRRKGWYRPAVVDASKQDYIELTELKAMLGVTGEDRIVMGCITQTEDGRYSLEDLSASLPLDVTETHMGDGFITENSIVVAEGQLQHNGSFRAHALGLPPVESREDSIAAAKGLDMFGGPPVKADHLLRASEWEAVHQENQASHPSLEILKGSETRAARPAASSAAAVNRPDTEDLPETDRVVVLSDVALDVPGTLDKLRAIFAGFEAMDEVPQLFVLMGNFQSDAAGAAGASGYPAMRENFNALAAMMRSFRRIRESSKIVFVPGPKDPGPGNVLPRPPLPAYFTEKLAEEVPGAVFSSNPCRVRYGTQQLVFFRGDMEACMRRQCLVPPQTEATPEAMFRVLAQTLLEQSHLSPVPLEVQPVHWQHDHALALYPLPHLLVLADSVPFAHTTFEDCVCLNPGSLADDTFAAYVPGEREVEECDVPNDE